MGGDIAAAIGPATFVNWDYPFEGDGWGQCEVCAANAFFDSSGNMVAYNQWSFSGLDCPYQVWNWYTYYGYLGWKVFDKGVDGDPNTTERFARHMYEDDEWDDDDWGTFSYYGTSPTDECFDTYSWNQHPDDGYTRYNSYWHGNVVSLGGY